jgi:hypothetical protein
MPVIDITPLKGRIFWGVNHRINHKAEAEKARFRPFYEGIFGTLQAKGLRQAGQAYTV